MVLFIYYSKVHFFRVVLFPSIIKIIPQKSCLKFVLVVRFWLLNIVPVVLIFLVWNLISRFKLDIVLHRCWSKVKRCWLIDAEKPEKSLKMLENRVRKFIRQRSILYKFDFSHFSGQSERVFMIVCLWAAILHFLNLKYGDVHVFTQF